MNFLVFLIEDKCLRFLGVYLRRTDVLLPPSLLNTLHHPHSTDELFPEQSFQFALVLNMCRVSVSPPPHVPCIVTHLYWAHLVSLMGKVHIWLVCLLPVAGCSICGHLLSGRKEPRGSLSTQCLPAPPAHEHLLWASYSIDYVGYLMYLTYP
jgi:hypothetical protein